MKKILICLAILSTLSLVSCNKKPSGDSTPTSDPSEVSPSDETEGKQKTQKVEFYIDYWHSEEPCYEMMWYPGIPMGECPKECQFTSKDATDPLFPNFLGWSQYSSSIDDTNIWDFKTDSKIGNSLILYGIWVGE